MMSTYGYGNPKNAVLQLNSEVSALFRNAKSIPGLEDLSFGDWEKTCAALPRQIDEETIRVAVVGPIKSGKSTFLNCLLKGDYLKRGAGVVTSIVTRVRAGDRLKATLFYKSWEEVNEDIQQALVLFPSPNWRSAEGPFDLRRDKERSELRQALNALNAEQRISDDARNRNMVLLSCYLQGYDAVSRFLSDQQKTTHYEAERFLEHWNFSGNESLAVYLKDIQLEIHSEAIGSNIEIADCQGSDSSNPLHLAMIQDYLRQANLLVYVISSRTGLRRADINFLSMIKKMGILDNILFILNCDFSEHQSIEDLMALAAQVGGELALIKPHPDLYTFSALFNLFSDMQERLAAKDRRRLEHWKTETDMVAFSEQDTRRFASAFNETLVRKRYALLFENHIERLNSIVNGMANWVGINREIISRDAASARKVAERIRKHQLRFDQILSALQSSLSGTVPKVRQEVGADVNRFFDTGSGGAIKAINAFVDGYPFTPESWVETLRVAGFSQTLYKVFQEFKQALDRFITEQLNPEIIRFVAGEELKVRQALQAIADPYESLIEDAHTEFSGLMGSLGISIEGRKPERARVPNMESLMHGAGIRMPSLSGTIGYTARIRTEAILRHGFYRVVAGFKKMLKKPVVDGAEDLRALKESMVRIKRETLQALAFHLKDYQENLKFKYLFHLAETAAERLSQAVAEQLQAYSADFGALGDHLSSTREDKERAAGVLAEMNASCRRIEEELGRLKQDVSVASSGR
jgi:GTPase SAR1 family protein